MSRLRTAWRRFDDYSHQISWVAGGLIALIAFTTLFSGEGLVGRGRALIAWVVLFAVALLAIPPTRARLTDRLDVNPSQTALVIVIVAGLFVGVTIAPGAADDPAVDEEPAERVATPEAEPTPIEATLTPSPTPAIAPTPTPTPDPTPTPEPTPTPTPEAADEPHVERIVAENLGELGLATAIAEDGSVIVFGLATGDLLVYDDAGEYDRLEPQPDSQATQIEVSEAHDRINLLYELDDLFGAITLDGEDVWAYELPWVWAIDSTPDLRTMVAVSNPAQGPGTVGMGINGEVQWSVDLADSTGFDVSVSETGAYVAVGADRYMDEDAEMVGWTGLKLYDETGDLLWTHETDEAVISVAVHEGEDLVVAGTDDGMLLAFDLDGDLRWSDETFGGWIEVSNDGSTVVTVYRGELLAFDPDGEERWTAQVDAVFDVYLSISDDGETVLVVEGAEGTATVVEQGEIIWEAAFEEGPIRGDLAADGETWSIILEDIEAEVAWEFVYRNMG